ncbi:penicillin-binding protein 2 [Paraburkholderia sp. JHI2823]|uniref:peptidoglycan D,D-transpeptidase FtsI family protein n=1 Tax=Paraburkholderia sp. JHI2823 TaxID=3112960 RepID=UPI00317EA807
MRRNVSFNQTPALKISVFSDRSKVMMVLIAAAFTLCAVRAFWIQVLGNDFYQKEGASRVEHTIDVPTERGKILDRTGSVLATNVPGRSIWVDPRAIPDAVEPGKVTSVANLLGISEQQINTKIASDRSFCLKRQVDLGRADAVRDLHVPGIYEIPESRRAYPEGEITAQLIGFTGIEGGGADGIELAQDKQLGSVDGKKVVVRDRVGHIVKELRYVSSPHPGADVRLALDRRIQYIAFKALRSAVTKSNAESASAIVVDSQTGEVLALANYPSYNPNDRSALHGPSLRNRAVTDVFEPGSIMKPITIATALDRGRITPNSLVETNRTLSLDGVTITDDANFGTLSVAGVIQKSSNIGATMIGLKVKPEEMWGTYTALGFGRAPEIRFPGAGVGIVRPWRKWHRIEQATMSYGYGMSVSLIQLAQAYTVFSNNGSLIPLSLYKLDAPPTGRKIFTQRTTDEVRKMLEKVVAAGGTARQAAVPGYSVGGKTGTAYIATRHGYEKNAYRASFVGIVPVRHPRLVIAVSVNRPQGARHYGGDVSGPVFAEIAQAAMHALNVEPDEPVARSAR